MDTCDLANRRCQPCEGGIAPLPAAECQTRVTALPGWTLGEHWIEKTFVFANHHQAMAFVNALAWVSHREDHHPQTTLGYKDVTVRYWTHAIGGLSENDFICAAKVEKLLAL